MQKASRADPGDSARHIFLATLFASEAVSPIKTDEAEEHHEHRTGDPGAKAFLGPGPEAKTSADECGDESDRKQSENDSEQEQKSASHGISRSALQRAALALAAD